MALCAAVLGIQILLFGFTLATFVGSALICGLVWLALRSDENKSRAFLQRLCSSLARHVLPCLHQKIHLSTELSRQSLTQLTYKLRKLHASRKALEQIYDTGPQEVRIALRDMAVTHKEMLILLRMTQRVKGQQEGVAESFDELVKALRKAEFYHWNEEQLLASIEKSTRFKTSHSTEMTDDRRWDRV